MKQERRSAKSIIEQYAMELMARTNDPAIDTKLDVLQAIANKMGWLDLFHKIRNRDRKEQWWQK